MNKIFGSKKALDLFMNGRKLQGLIWDKDEYIYLGKNNEILTSKGIELEVPLSIMFNRRTEYLIYSKLNKHQRFLDEMKAELANVSYEKEHQCEHIVRESNYIVREFVFKKIISEFEETFKRELK